MASEPKQLLAQIHALSAPPEYEEHDLGPSWQLGQIREALGAEDAAEAAREMREVLAEHQWCADGAFCVECGKHLTEGHSADCRLARLIARKG